MKTQGFKNRIGSRVILILLGCVFLITIKGYSQIGIVNVDSCYVREASGLIIDLATLPPMVPCPNGEDGLARSSSHYFYCSNGSGGVYPDSVVWKIDLAGNLVVWGWYPGANFQGLAYVTEADSAGNDMLYGLDVSGNQLIQFSPITMIPIAAIPIMPGTGKRAVSGGRRNLFLQTEVAPSSYEIWKYNTRAGIWGPSVPTAVGGAVLFDGLALFGRLHIGIDAHSGWTDVWRYDPTIPDWVLIAPPPPTLFFWGSAVGGY